MGLDNNYSILYHMDGLEDYYTKYKKGRFDGSMVQAAMRNYTTYRKNPSGVGFTM